MTRKGTVVDILICFLLSPLQFSTHVRQLAWSESTDSRGPGSLECGQTLVSCQLILGDIFPGSTRLSSRRAEAWTRPACFPLFSLRFFFALTIGSSPFPHHTAPCSNFFPPCATLSGPPPIVSSTRKPAAACTPFRRVKTLPLSTEEGFRRSPLTFQLLVGKPLAGCIAFSTPPRSVRPPFTHPPIE